VPDTCFIFDGHELVELEPYDFQLSKQLEEKVLLRTQLLF